MFIYAFGCYFHLPNTTSIVYYSTTIIRIVSQPAYIAQRSLHILKTHRRFLGFSGHSNQQRPHFFIYQHNSRSVRFVIHKFFILEQRANIFLLQTNGILYKHVSPRKCGRKSSESSENDAMQNREYLVPRECYFLLAIFCHSECGHRGRDPTVEVMRRHKLHGPPKDFINKWIDLCPTCKAKPGQKNSRKPRTGKMAAKPKPVTAIKRSRARRTTDTSAPSSIPVAVANPTQPINLVGEAEAAPAAETNTAPLENTDYVDDQRFNHPPYGTVNPTQSTGLAGEFKAASVAKTDLVEARSLRHEGKECYIPIWLLTPPNPLNATSNSSQLPGIAEQAPPVYGAQLPQPANPQVNPAPAWTAPPTVSTLTMNAPEQPPAAEFSELFNSSSGPEDWDDDASFQKWYESHETEEQVSKNTGVALFAPSTTAAPQTTSRPSILDAVPAIPIPPTTQNVYVPSSLVDWSIWPVPQVPDWNELPAEGLAQPPFNDGTTMNGDSLGPLNTFSMPAQPAMNGFEQLAMNSFQQPAMNDFQQPAMNDFQQPAMDYFEPPSRNGWQQPATNNFGQLSMNGFQQPSMNNFAPPSMHNCRQPSLNYFQQPSTNNFQQPSMNNFEPRPINPGAAANKDPFQTLPIDFDILAQQHPIPEDSSDLQEQGIEWDRTLFPDDPWLFP